MKVLIAVGGGGHFSPALAVMGQMPKEWQFLLVGRKYTFEGDSALSLEYQTAKRLGFAFEPLTTGRLQRKFTRHTLKSLVKMPVGFAQATKIITKYKPDVVLSFGGYVSVPVVLAASAFRLPIVIHEQTLHAGLANKIAARFATKICISWKESEQFFSKKKTVLTGNPLRKTFLDPLPNTLTIKGEVLYITGGSGGAHGINLLIEGCLEKLLAKYTVIHQTGDAKEFNDFQRLAEKKKSLPEEVQKKYDLHKFIEPEKVMQILRRADLIISRSGINTVTELLYLGKLSLLIPLPYGQHNEQLTNAQFVKKIGLAEVVNQLTVTPDALAQKISEMLSQRDEYTKHQAEGKALIHTDAAERIVKEVERVSKPTYSSSSSRTATLRRS